MAYHIRSDRNPGKRKRGRLRLLLPLLALAALAIQNREPLLAGFSVLWAGDGWYKAALVWCRMTLGLVPG